jgi:hypothetical protein
MFGKSFVGAIFCLAIVGFAIASSPVLAQDANRNGLGQERALAAGLVGPVPVDGPWLEFQFGATGSSGAACTGCTPSSAGNSVFAGNPPWKFSAPSAGARLTVTDAFLNGDRFEVFDFGVSIGQTSAVATSGACGDDPEPCSVSPTTSHAIFDLGGGPHELTIKAINSPFNAGAAYFRVDAFDHLICYKIRPTKPFHQRKVKVKNQFGDQNFVVLQPDTLCVPSTKRVLPH